MSKQHGFTLVELMVVILIVGILAAAAVPLMRGRIETAKWSEANATAGTIRSAVRVYFAETGDTKALANKTLDKTNIQTALGFAKEDLEGNYFTAKDYKITSIDSTGKATIQVTSGSKTGSPSGSATLDSDGTWTIKSN
jgi:prepilin-type N-terminal cleavage/methylation domain-containing protein